MAAFIAVTTLFFAWGFVTQSIDPLIPSVRAIFSLSYTESMLTQFAFFMSYFVVSLPGAALVARLGLWRARSLRPCSRWWWLPGHSARHAHGAL